MTAALSYRGAARMLAGDFEGAIADHDLAIKLDPSFHTAYVNRAAARSRRGDNGRDR